MAGVLPIQAVVLSRSRAFLWGFNLLIGNADLARRAAAAAGQLVSALAFAFAAKHDFKTGKLINIDYEERLINGTSFRSAILTVEVGGVVYGARGDRMRRHSGDPGHGLIIGDPVQAAIDGDPSSRWFRP